MNQDSNLFTAWLQDAGPRARAASATLATAPDAQRNAGLQAAAAALRRHGAALHWVGRAT